MRFISGIFFAAGLFGMVSCLQSSYASDVTQKASEQTLILGVLEDVPGEYIVENHSYKVRAVFHKNGVDWEAYPSSCSNQDCLSQYPPEVTWNIGFNGHLIGQIVARTPDEFKFYSHVGLQDIVSKTPIPVIGKKSIEYSGYEEQPVYRPLVANSQRFFRDPEAWKPAILPDKLVKLVRQQFRKKFPAVSNCKNPEENKVRPWEYQDTDIKIEKSYSSKSHWSAIQGYLDGYRCDGPPDDAFIDQWFIISPSGNIEYLDQGLWLVDAGDYDNDGKSELLFSIYRNNRGGYELFYDNFEKRAVFEFGYH